MGIGSGCPSYFFVHMDKSRARDLTGHTHMITRPLLSGRWVLDSR